MFTGSAYFAHPHLPQFQEVVHREGSKGLGCEEDPGKPK